MIPRINPRQLARGVVVSPTTILNMPLYGLYNNSTGAHALVVRDVRVNRTNGTLAPGAAQAALPVTMGTTRGLTMATTVVGVPIVSGDATPPGQLFYFDDPADEPYDFSVNFNGPQDSMWGNPYPLAILLPGWQFFVQDFYGVMNNNSSNGPNGVSFVWQAVPAEDIDGLGLLMLG
jgi:hypothetical protein